MGFNNLNIALGVTHNETYWGLTEQGVVYAIDNRYGNVMTKHFEFPILTDNIVNTVVHQLYRTDAELNFLFGNDIDVDSYQFFGSSTKAIMSWKSAKFIEGSYTERKTYKDIYVRATAGIVFKVYIEDQVDNLVAEHKFRETETHHIKVDSAALQGYAIYFTAEGTGIIYEIEYKTMGRQNGR